MKLTRHLRKKLSFRDLQTTNDYLPLRFMKEERKIIERIGLPADIKVRITPTGEIYFKNLKEEHNRVRDFYPYFSKRKKRIFNLEEAEIGFLELMLENEEMSLLELIRSVRERGKRFKWPIKHLLEKHCIQLLNS